MEALVSLVCMKGKLHFKSSFPDYFLVPSLLAVLCRTSHYNIWNVRPG